MMKAKFLGALAAVTSCLVCGGAVADSAVKQAQAVEYGRRIYMDGVLSSGEPLKATVSGDVEITGEFVVCGECHRRSGIGASEGESVAPPVVGSLLYEPLQLPTSRPPAPPVQRPAYTRESLAASIRDGISSNGSEFSMLMPRYPLSDEDMGYLIAYLESLSAGPDPGVTDQDIHFATIVTDDVNPEARKAMLDVMQHFIEQKNTETRYETKRATSGPWHKDWMFKPYRKWVLHTWELAGPPSSWTAQLEDFYAGQPVFAVVNGLSGGSWEPMHRFCEDKQVPCLFPTTDLPVVDREDFYSIYLSKGIAIEAEAVAQKLIDDGVAADSVVQIYSPDNAESRAAAQALHRLLGDSAGPIDRAALGAGDLTAPVVVAWLDLAEVNALPDIDGQAVYLSGTLLAGREGQLNDSIRKKARLVYSTEIPGETARLLARSTGWFRFKRIYAPEYEAIQANAYFTMKMLGGGLFSIHGFFNRDYFIERIEHMVDNATYTSVYPRISLAPEQRFVSKGAKIARFDPEDSDRLVTVVDWMVPSVN